MTCRSWGEHIVAVRVDRIIGAIRAAFGADADLADVWRLDVGGSLITRNPHFGFFDPAGIWWSAVCDVMYS